MPELRSRAYRNGELIDEDFPVAAVEAHLLELDTVVWVDFCEPSIADLEAVAAAFGLHELAVEDALAPHQRPRLVRYATHLFLSCHAVQVDADQQCLDETGIDAFVNDRWLVTVRKAPTFRIESVMERWDRSPDLRREGVSFLLYGLLDVIIDGYFDAVEEFDTFYDTISEGIFAETPLNPADQKNWFNMRRALVRFHRLAIPMREAVSTLMRREHSAVSEEMYPYYQDVYDHILRVSESSDALRDLVTTIVETDISLRDYRQNLIMKKVTSWAAIIAVPTLITGWYGMNVPYPGFAEAWGVVASGGLVFGISGALYLSFKRREWL